MLIGEVARVTGISLNALRRYEQERMVTPARVGADQHRVYSDADVARLRMLQALRALNVPLWKVGIVLRVAFDGDRSPQNMRVAHAVAAQVKDMATIASETAKAIWRSVK